MWAIDLDIDIILIKSVMWADNMLVGEWPSHNVDILC